MSAETLRRAAALMRERAEAATPGPWEASIGDSGVSYRSLNASVITESHGDLVCDADYDGDAEGPHGNEGADAHHIASWHPAVALAVADWLDEESLNASLVAHTNVPADAAWSCSCLDCRPTRALAVARAYLGESS